MCKILLETPYNTSKGFQRLFPFQRKKEYGATFLSELYVCLLCEYMPQKFDYEAYIGKNTKIFGEVKPDTWK
jgi:hypothetical protein